MQLLRHITTLLLLVSALSYSNAQTQRVMRLSVLSDGKMLLNGTSTTLPELKAAFKQLKEEKGVVWYYREQAQREPTPEAMSAFQLIVDYSLPVSLSSKADFSDYVDGTGKSNPRPKQ